MKLYEDCLYWRTLPHSGGMLDQPYGMLERMQAAQQVAMAIGTYNEHWTEPGWIEGNPETMRIVMEYWRLREEAERGH